MTERHHIHEPGTPYAPGATKARGHVAIHIGEEAARTLAGQHFGWMATNLLARMEDTIGTLTLVLSGVPALARNIVPFSEAAGYRTAILEGAQAIRRSCAIRDQLTGTPDVLIVYGRAEIPANAGRRVIHATARRWVGGVSSTPQHLQSDDDPNPIGAYVAAALAAAEAFKVIVDMSNEHADVADDLAINAWLLRVSSISEAASSLDADNPRWHGADLGRVHVVGAGAVANALLHTWMALPDLRGRVTVIDRADKPLKETNLNRYLLAAMRDIAVRHKAVIVQQNLRGRATFDILPRNDGWARVAAGAGKEAAEAGWHDVAAIEREGRFENVLSCVDRNRERHPIQGSVPKNLAQGSTHQFNAQVRRFRLRDPNGACLKCFNPVEAIEVDDAIKQRLQGRTREERAEISRQHSLDPTDVEAWLDGDCEGLSGAEIEKLRLDLVGNEFSVSFVSALSGILLASEYLKEILGTPTLPELSHAARYYFLTNSLDVTPKAIDRACACQTAGLREYYAVKWPTSTTNRMTPSEDPNVDRSGIGD